MGLFIHLNLYTDSHGQVGKEANAATWSSSKCVSTFILQAKVQVNTITSNMDVNLYIFHTISSISCGSLALACHTEGINVHVLCLQLGGRIALCHVFTQVIVSFVNDKERQ